MNQLQAQKVFVDGGIIMLFEDPGNMLPAIEKHLAELFHPMDLKKMLVHIILDLSDGTGLFGLLLRNNRFWIKRERLGRSQALPH